MGAAIYRDDQRGAFAGEADERCARRAVAFEQAVRDVGARFDAEVAQDQDHQRGGGGAVDVVIAEDRDLFVCLDGVGEALGGAVHVAEDRRVGHERADRGGAVCVECVAGAAPGEEELGDEVVARTVDPKAVPAICGERAPAPGLAEERRGYAENCHASDVVAAGGWSSGEGARC